jgi:hypothetical protein
MDPMKRLFGFAIVVAVAWYGWKHYNGLNGAPANEVVIENDSGVTLGRVRISISGKDYPAYDSLYSGKSIKQSFPTTTPDGQFDLRWVTQSGPYDISWKGGQITAGPVRMRHVLQVQAGGGVVWMSSPIPAKS